MEVHAFRMDLSLNPNLPYFQPKFLNSFVQFGWTLIDMPFIKKIFLFSEMKKTFSVFPLSVLDFSF